MVLRSMLCVKIILLYGSFMRNLHLAWIFFGEDFDDLVLRSEDFLLGLGIGIGM
jgi:hypothetical protein